MKYSKIIKPTRTTFDYDAKLRSNLNKFRGYSLDKAVHVYRMWFYFVRLVYELETNKIKFGVNNKLSVKLNKKFYKDWEIENYLDASFDTWFQNKIHLFAEEQASLVKEGAKSDDYLYIKFNRRQRKTDIVRQVRNLLKSERYQSQAKYQIKNQYKYFYLHQQYNVLIMRIEGKSAVEIADFIEGTYGKYSERYSTSYSSLRRLFRASERLILNVAKGEF